MSIASDVALRALTQRVAELEREVQDLKANFREEEPANEGGKKPRKGWKWVQDQALATKNS